jgi:hypothetical protein
MWWARAFQNGSGSAAISFAKLIDRIEIHHEPIKMVNDVAYQLNLKLLAQTRSLPEGGFPRRRCAEPTGKVLIIKPFRPKVAIYTLPNLFQWTLGRRNS